MAVGLHSVNLANAWLNLLRNTAFTAKTAVYAKLHTADPGASAATAASAETTRQAMTFSAAASGSMALTTTYPVWASWTAGSETITHVSVWDASTAGNFLYSFALDVSKSVVNGDTLTLNSHSISFTPVAA